MSESTLLDTAFEQIRSAVGDARGGLPEDVFLFVSRLTPLVNVDLLIQDARGRTLLTWRDDELFGSGWHVPGSVIRYKEFATDRVRTCARAELGATVTCDPAPVLLVEAIAAGQEYRGHAISLVYRCRLESPPDPARRARTIRPRNGEWKWHASCPSDLLPVQREYARFFR
jgi:colanic acid biosynthesis protein WcaH